MNPQTEPAPTLDLYDELPSQPSPDGIDDLFAKLPAPGEVAPRVTGIVMLKGGFGKTTLARELPHRLTERGYRCLICDFDPEGHLSTGYGYYERESESDATDLGDILVDGADPASVIETTDWGFDIIPAQNVDLTNSRLDSDDLTASDRRVQAHITDPLAGDQYDFIFIDTPGSGKKLSKNTLVAADHFIFPITPSSQAISGVRQTTKKFLENPRTYGIDVDVLATVPNELDNRIDYEYRDRRILESMNTGRQFAGYLMAGRDGVQADDPLPEDVNMEAFLDDHIPPFARLREDDWERIDAGEYQPKPPIRSNDAFEEAYTQRVPLGEYDPTDDQLPYLDQLAAIVVNGGITDERW